MTNQNTFLYPIFKSSEIATSPRENRKRLREMSDNVGIKMKNHGRTLGNCNILFVAL